MLTTLIVTLNDQVSSSCVLHVMIASLRMRCVTYRLPGTRDIANRTKWQRWSQRRRRSE